MDGRLDTVEHFCTAFNATPADAREFAHKYLDQMFALSESILPSFPILASTYKIDQMADLQKDQTINWFETGIAPNHFVGNYWHRNSNCENFYNAFRGYVASTKDTLRLRAFYAPKYFDDDTEPVKSDDAQKHLEEVASDIKKNLKPEYKTGIKACADEKCVNEKIDSFVKKTVQEFPATGVMSRSLNAAQKQLVFMGHVAVSAVAIDSYIHEN